jgi:hypothetical protein
MIEILLQVLKVNIIKEKLIKIEFYLFHFEASWRGPAPFTTLVGTLIILFPVSSTEVDFCVR